MKPQTTLLILTLLAFGALSAFALSEHGYFGIFAYHIPSSAGWQVLSDLVIVCILAMIWMVIDARKTGRNAWPYVIATLFAGSFGPLAYLLIGQLRESRAA